MVQQLIDKRLKSLFYFVGNQDSQLTPIAGAANGSSEILGSGASEEVLTCKRPKTP
jgi:hypothetical protein